MTQTTDNGGVNHLREKVQNDDQTLLTREEAKEQLLWTLRDQRGEITFDVNEYEGEGVGDGAVIANVNGREADHWVYYEEN